MTTITIPIELEFIVRPAAVMNAMERAEVQRLLTHPFLSTALDVLLASAAAAGAGADE